MDSSSDDASSDEDELDAIHLGLLNSGALNASNSGSRILPGEGLNLCMVPGPLAGVSNWEEQQILHHYTD